MFTEISEFTQQNQAGAKCSLCNQHARERNGVRARTFRTNLYIHMEGWVEVCEWCIAEGGTKIGMIPVDQAEELEDLRETADAHAMMLLDQLNESRRLVQSLSAELGRQEDETALKVTKAYDRGYEDGMGVERAAV